MYLLRDICFVDLNFHKTLNIGCYIQETLLFHKVFYLKYDVRYNYRNYLNLFEYHNCLPCIIIFYVTRCYNVRLMHNQLKVDCNIVTETITLLTIRLGLPSVHLSPQTNKQQHHSVNCCN